MKEPPYTEKDAHPCILACAIGMKTDSCSTSTLIQKNWKHLQGLNDNRIQKEQRRKHA